MLSKSSLKNIFDVNTLILVAPVLVFVSAFHIFDSNPTTHQFGQIEIFAALFLCIYYLWEKIPIVFANNIGKKRLTLGLCILGGLLSAFLLLPPLLTWQYFALYQSTGDKQTYKRPVLLAILTLWVGVAMLFGSAYTLTAAQFATTRSTMPEAPK